MNQAVMRVFGLANRQGIRNKRLILRQKGFNYQMATCLNLNDAIFCELWLN